MDSIIKSKLFYLNLFIIIIGALLVSFPFINKILQEDSYRKELQKIADYVTKVSEGKQDCTVNFGENKVTSTCREKLILSDHIVIEPLQLNYGKRGELDGTEILVISSRKFDKQYCIGFSGLIIREGYYDGECQNFENLY